MDAEKPNSVAKRKRIELEGQGYVVNGVAFIHLQTRRRGLLDNLGAVHWIEPPASQPQDAVDMPSREFMAAVDELVAQGIAPGNFDALAVAHTVRCACGRRYEVPDPEPAARGALSAIADRISSALDGLRYHSMEGIYGFEPIIAALDELRALEARPDPTPGAVEAEPCFACGRPLSDLDTGVLVDTRDGQLVRVGADCFRKVRASGHAGYQPQKGGPRLWLLAAHPQPAAEGTSRG